MGLILAFKAFFRAFSDTEGAKKFVEGKAQEVKISDVQDQSHLRLLSMLQQSSRLIDFIKEDISSFDDSQVGMAVRTIHAECGRCLEELVTLRPILEENEGAKHQVNQGYDPTKIKVVGNVRGDPPFSGIVVHKGWKAHKRSLPKKVGEQLSDVICPAEIEIH